MSDPMAKYWICDECAKARQLMHWKSGNTHCLGRCGHCGGEEEKMLTPIVDLISSKTKGDSGEM